MFSLDYENENAKNLFSHLADWQYRRYQELLENIQADPCREGKPLKGKSNKGRRTSRFLRKYRVIFKIDHQQSMVIIMEGEKRSKAYRKKTGRK